MRQRFIPSRKFESGVILAILASIACLAAAIFWNVPGARKDFYNNLWGPAYLLVHGDNPYDTSSLSAELPPVWLPMGISVFAPLGWIEEQPAVRVWFLFNVATLAAIVYIGMGEARSLPAAAVGGLMAFLFPPTIHHLVLGQFSITAALSILLASICAGSKRDWPAAFLLALAMTKPQLGFLAVIGLGFHSFQRYGWGGAVKFGSRLAVAGIVLSLPLFFTQPGWNPDWLAGLQSNPAWQNPSVFTLLRLLSGKWAYPLWGIIAAGGIFTCWQIWKRLPAHTAMPWTLGLTLLISPYLWSWDFVLLLPIWIHIFTQVNWRKRIFLFLAYLAGWVGMAMIQLSQNDHNLRFWWVPAWFIGVLLLVWRQRPSLPAEKESNEAG